tara:strand:- start:101 stop:928 length:828 start_codon:yes stop_codon:yes gene_type:complete
MFLYKIKIFLLRIIGYDKPLRLAVLKYFTRKYKTFRPYYETILLEGAIEAKKIGYKTVSVLELGVAGGNGIIALEKYKEKIEKLINIKINVYGFDSGEGLPDVSNKFDLPYLWEKGIYKINREKLEKKINSKIFYGDIKDTVDDFIKINPENIIAIFSDLDLYTSTKNFLNQISKLKKHLCPRTYCYFDGIFHVNHWINVHNAELLAIQEFNNENNDCKIGKSLSNSSDFKFPIGRENLFMLHNFTHKDYYLNIGSDQNFSLDIKSKEIGKIFDF